MTDPFGRLLEVPPSLAESSFNRTIKPPGHAVLPGPWDLRGNFEHFLGDVDFRGRRGLEIGTAKEAF